MYVGRRKYFVYVTFCTRLEFGTFKKWLKTFNLAKNAVPMTCLDN